MPDDPTRAERIANAASRHDEILQRIIAEWHESDRRISGLAPMANRAEETGDDLGAWDEVLRDARAGFRSAVNEYIDLVDQSLVHYVSAETRRAVTRLRDQLTSAADCDCPMNEFNAAALGRIRQIVAVELNAPPRNK